MKIRSTLYVVLVLSFTSMPLVLAATEWYVAPPPLGQDEHPGTQQEPFATIQKGIDEATGGDTVIVSQGTYFEFDNVNFHGKNIVLRSTDPSDPSVVQSTIIDGNQAGSVVTFDGTEDETCVLSGFTIQNGRTSVAFPESGGGINGGTFDRHTHATIQNNVISGNSAVPNGNGGGLAYCDGTIKNNTITDNSAWGFGGGLHDCDGIIQNNTIVGNGASHGGGLDNCGGTIQNNVITGNSAETGMGGGLQRCHGTIQNNTITDNWAAMGGGLYACDGTMQNNIISANFSEGYGGGVYGCSGTIQNNTISGNSAATGRGGGLGYYTGTIQNNTISGNSAGSTGGGLSYCTGTIQNNAITGNWAGAGGGLDYCHGTIQNNKISGNSAGDSGGALHDCDGIIQNNTIVGNTAANCGGALYQCQAMIRNCIVWGNTAGTGPQVHESSVPTYSCIPDWTGPPGPGNITHDPQFVDADKGNFRLLPSSPCIDAGRNDPELPQTDIAGMHRIMFGGKSPTVDMGAYEFYINDLKPGLEQAQTTFTWSSLQDKTYSIFCTDDLLTWHLAIENFPSSGNETTSWTDDGSLTGLPPLLAPRRFYRVLENP